MPEFLYRETTPAPTGAPDPSVSPVPDLFAPLRTLRDTLLHEAAKIYITGLSVTRILDPENTPDFADDASRRAAALDLVVDMSIRAENLADFLSRFDDVLGKCPVSVGIRTPTR